MPVYSYRMINLLETSLTSLSSMMFSKTPLVLSGDEFLAAFVDPEHIPMLKQVQEICKPTVSSYGNTVFFAPDGETINMQIQFAGTAPVILPQYVRHGLQPSCPQDIKDRIDAWVAERLNFGRAFGDAKDAIAYLNDTCGDVEAMTLMLPCLPTIMAGISTDGDSKTVKRAQKLTSIKRFGKLPRIPRRVTQRLAEVSAIVNATTLMSDAAAPGVVRFDALFTLSTISGQPRVNIFYQDADPSAPVPAASFL